MMIQYSVGTNFVLFVTNWLRNSGNMKAVSTHREPDVKYVTLNAGNQTCRKKEHNVRNPTCSK